MSALTWANLVLGENQANIYSDPSAHYAHILLEGGVSSEALARTLRMITPHKSTITVDGSGDIQYPASLTPMVLTMLRRIYPKIVLTGKARVSTYTGELVTPVGIDYSKVHDIAEFRSDLERYGYTDDHPAKCYRDQYRSVCSTEEQRWAEVQEQEDYFYVRAMMGLVGAETTR